MSPNTPLWATGLVAAALIGAGSSLSGQNTMSEETTAQAVWSMARTSALVPMTGRTAHELQPDDEALWPAGPAGGPAEPLRAAVAVSLGPIGRRTGLTGGPRPLETLDARSCSPSSPWQRAGGPPPRRLGAMHRPPGGREEGPAFRRPRFDTAGLRRCTVRNRRGFFGPAGVEIEMDGHDVRGLRTCAAALAVSTR